MTNHNTLRKLISEAVWGASLDLQDAYLHVPIRKNHHKFMAFCHGHQLYFFKVLPIGLNVAPMIFSKILKHPLSRLHQEGIPVLAYLDDWITWAPNKFILQINLRKILSLLKNLGFLINYKKSLLTPASDITWLGVMVLLPEKGASPRSPQREPQDVVVSIDATRPNALPAAPPQNRPVDRCIFVWLGCTFRQGSLLPGAVVHSRRDSSHQHPGGSGGHQGYRISESPHISSHRQRGSEICYQQAQVEGSGTLPLPDHALPSPQIPQPCNNCLQDPVLPEPHSRCSQQGPSPNDGMVSPHERLQQNHCLERRGGGGPNGDSPQQEGGDVRLSSPPSSSGSNRRQDG